MGETGLPPVEIKYLKIYHERGRVKTITLDGREDILNDAKVKKELEEGGRPIALGGLLRYKGFDFDFRVGHTFGLPGVDFGTLWVKKKGAASGHPSLVEEVYELMMNLYREIFLKDMRDES